MEALSWRELDFGSVVFAGLIGGYIMAIAGLWAGKVPGLSSFDIADFDSSILRHGLGPL